MTTQLEHAIALTTIALQRQVPVGQLVADFLETGASGDVGADTILTTHRDDGYGFTAILDALDDLAQFASARQALRAFLARVEPKANE